ncbi:hypothetical protein DM872_07680 [Pseudomonas taiwanensis]|uniref:hypothetical protein n=1 Tax=Pseudomonas taiwanensis TaxID=470150 RepID=UPI0015BDBFAD|nr:hypothetical protein [Pseudomonas taiwanensis]NWL76727.1 hypothetical protein [Pseudomonas taiwanensis]
MDIWEILQDELERYKSSTLAVRHCLSAYESKCTELIKEIPCRSFDQAQDCFDALYAIQNKLAVAKYKYEFSLPDRLDIFVYQFERDDISSREYWYGKFKEGQEWPHDE